MQPPLASQRVETALFGLGGPLLASRLGVTLQLFAALLTRLGLGQRAIDLLMLRLMAEPGIFDRRAGRAAGIIQIFLHRAQQVVGKAGAPVLAGRLARRVRI